MTGGQAIVECLHRAGIRWIYGIPGGQTLAIMDALYDQSEIRFVTTRHEGAAACMADAMGRLSGETGVCLATTGPGATNLITGVGGALKDSSPVLVLVANNRAQHLGRDDTQAADHVAIFRPLTKETMCVYHPSDIVPKLRWSLQAARAGCPGPVLLDVARDVLEGDVDASALEAFRLAPLARPGADTTEIQRIIGRLATSARPVLWCGNGLKLSRGGKRLLDLAERLAVPCVTTYNGIGGVPTTHPLAFGVASRMGAAVGIEALAQSDCVVAIGNSLNAVSTGRWTMRLPEEIVQIDLDPQALGRNYPITVGAVADAGTALAQLLEVLGERDAAAARQRHRPWIDHLTDARERWRAAIAEDAVEGGPVRPQTLMAALNQRLPQATNLIVDAGNPGLWSFLLEIREAMTYMKPVGFGNMGFALPAAIAVKLAQPDRPVLCLIGDGSLGMTLAEIETAVREHAAVPIVVMNDGGYGNIRQEEALRYGPRYIGVDFGVVDYAAVARALGADGERVEHSSALAGALDRAFSADGLYLVDVVVARDVDVWTYPPFQAVEHGE